MEIFRIVVEIIGGITVIGAFFCVVFKWVSGFAEGQKSLLRAEMLKTYYKYKDTKAVPQYELENFHKMKDAYFNLKGNSFIKDIAEEVETWTMIR